MSVNINTFAILARCINSFSFNVQTLLCINELSPNTLTLQLFEIKLEALLTTWLIGNFIVGRNNQLFPANRKEGQPLLWAWSSAKVVNAIVSEKRGFLPLTG